MAETAQLCPAASQLPASRFRSRPPVRLAASSLRIAVARSLCVRSGSAAGNPPDSTAPRHGKDADSVCDRPEQKVQVQPLPVWKQWTSNASEMRTQVAKLGLAAVLAYGLFDGITYTTFFVLAFLGYEKTTGNNPAANIQALVGIVVTMWAGNNVTRPFRVAGAAAIAPPVDRFLKKVQATMKLPNQAFAFMVVVASFASLCFSIVGLLILSRWGR